MTDITMENHGSVVLLIPETPAGREWLDANLDTEPWQWLGGALGVDPRVAWELAEMAAGDGLEVA